MIFVFFFVVVISDILAAIIYLYADECIRIRKRLRRLGVSSEEINKFPKRANYFYLKEKLYEKETQLAEECFLTVEK